MDKIQQIEIIAKGTVEIPTDEYADLLAARTRLDILCDFMDADSSAYVDKDNLFVIARGTPEKSPSQTTPETSEASGEIE